MHSVLENRNDGSCTAASTSFSAGAASFLRHPLFQGAVLFLFTLLLYWPSYHAGFILDDEAIAANPLYREGWAGLRDIWFSLRFGDFVPFTATSFWVEWQGYGAMREIQHATNIVLQALNVVLLWQLLRRLKIPGAWLAAAVFAAHPVCVFSVTWLAERKNTLSMFLYLLSLLLYFLSETADARPEASPSEPPLVSSSKRLLLYWFSFALFVLGLLSKSSVVILPVALLLIAWWQRGRIGLRDLKRTAPFFLVAFSMGAATLAAHYIFGPRLGINSTTDPFLVRTITATKAVWFYLGKDFFPVGLTLLYPRWAINPASPWSYLPMAGILYLFIVLWRYRQTWGKAFLLGLGYFILALAPSLGLAKMSFLALAQVADHLQYLALPGLIVLCVGSACWLAQKYPGTQKTAPALILLCGVVPLAALSWQHQRVVANPEAMWLDNARKSTNCWTAHNNLGRLLANQNNFDQAAAHFREAIRIKPDLAPAHYNLGRAYLLKGDINQAIQCFSNTIAITPDNFAAELALADALTKWGNNDQAVFHHISARCRQGKALRKEGRTAEAMSLWREALKIRPDSVEALDNLAWALATTPDDKLRNGTEAVELAERVCSLVGPKVPPVLDTLAAAYAEKGRFAEATNAIGKAILLVETAGDANALTKYRGRLELYRHGQPCRE